jgi:hypothetical protein
MTSSTWPRFLLSCLAALALSAAARGEEKGKSHALLIGVKDYPEDSPFAPLKYTENDVEELARVLDRRGSPFEGNVRLLSGTRGKKKPADAPTAANVRKAVAALAKGKRKDDVILVALAGHGIQVSVKDPKGKGEDRRFAYFCPQDATNTSNVDYQTGRHETLILLTDLLGDLGESDAGCKLVLVDACRNGKGADSLRVNKSQVPDGVAVLFSCKNGQQAWETPNLGKAGHGVFFHYVIRGLKWDAADKNGKVTWSSLVDYVTENVEAQVPKLLGKGATQQPHQITNLERKSPLLLIPADLTKPPKVEGQVTKVAGDFVTISIGSDVGLEVGHVLEVFRLGDKPQYVGRLELKDVSQSTAVGKIIGKVKNAPKVGDRVADSIR